MKFNIYTVWMDPNFYIAAVVFALALFLLVFSIRKYLEIENQSDFEKTDDEAGEVQGELPMAGGGQEVFDTASTRVSAEAVAEDPEPGSFSEASDEPAAVPPPAEAETISMSRAEEFVKGLYEHLASLDGRVKNIEADLSRSKVNRDFTAKFLEDMVADFDSLDKTKIKSRIEYLLADLKK